MTTQTTYTTTTGSGSTTTSSSTGTTTSSTGSTSTTTSGSNGNGGGRLNNPTVGNHPGQGVVNRSGTATTNSNNVAASPTVGSQPGDYPWEQTQTGGGGIANSVKETFYYHPDHLGSTSFVTDDKGELYEHVGYFPFGETWYEESSNGQKVDYLFTSKELDAETGLYYFGARYYDPRTSVWQSADPILEEYLPEANDWYNALRKGVEFNPKKYLPGMGGVYNSLNLDLFAYAQQNPLKLVDPNGKTATTADPDVVDFGKAWGWVKKGLAVAGAIGLTVLETVEVAALSLLPNATAKDPIYETNKAIDELDKKSTPNDRNTRGPARGKQRDVDGDAAEAESDFDNLPGEVINENKDRDSKTKRLPDGSTANIHTSPKSGERTIEIHKNGELVRKYRYKKSVPNSGDQ